MSVSSKIEQIFVYLEHAIDPDGANAAPLLESQFGHLTTIINRYAGALELADVTASLKLLRSSACPFGETHAKALRASINASVAPSAHGDGGHDVVRIYAKTQIQVYIHQYLSEQQWFEVLKDEATIDSIIDVIVSVLAATGCVHPSPNPSQKHIVSFIHALMNQPFTADDFYKTLTKLRTAIHLQRKYPVPGAPSGISKYGNRSRFCQKLSWCIP